MKIQRLGLGITIFATFVSMLMLSCNSAWPALVYRYMDMPSDSVTLFPDFPNTFQSSLTSYGISTLRPAGGGGISNFSSQGLNDDVAPFGNALYWDANTFNFTKPVYAVGFTFISTDYPNSDAPWSFDNDVQDVSHQVQVFDKNGIMIENVFSSSWTTRTGPRHFYGTLFLASYAGIWTDTPIYSVTFGGIRPTDGVLRATYGSFAFSETPYSTVPIPSTMLLLGSGLIGLVGLRKRFRK